ncbi:glycosyltransferase family 2 protein [Iamia majanohamensis]|uniref:Glycosyltransferase family 2 protein n=1 Tax=Iamia majanohamensis TaxID=467976 RepID=A0AAF0BQR4_9ACTN|nr:glycosyltransferase family 2 protein [Iamia majanohamensis]WCO65181.1 glycosyltransferase family 2 protein [Iamia majanohamensis]
MARDVLLGLLVVVAVAGAAPLLIGIYQYLLVGLHAHRHHLDETGPDLPRTAVLIPAWNEADVLATTIHQLMRLDYPRDRLVVVVVDDASTDATGEVLAALAAEHPGMVVHLRREDGGQGKAHTLNHGLRALLADGWMEALLVMDADVVYEPDSLRRMARHLADPEVGAVTAYIKEGSEGGSYLTRFVAYEYVTAQAAARRSQHAIGAIACLAGGAQLHSRANLEALGGQIDTSTLAEDTITTFETQRAGRKVVFEPHAVVWAEEPGDITGLWKQRLRWARGNVQVTRRYKGQWLRPSTVHRLGSVTFALLWFATLLLPVVMITSAAALVALWGLDRDLSTDAFRALWIVNALGFVFTTTFALLLDPSTTRRAWKEAVLFPGVISLFVILHACVPAVFRSAAGAATDLTGIRLGTEGSDLFLLAAYLWVAVCMPASWLAKRIDQAGFRRLAGVLVYVVGYGPILCAVTFAAYVAEARGAEQRWDKTVKTGKVAART